MNDRPIRGLAEQFIEDEALRLAERERQLRAEGMAEGERLVKAIILALAAGDHTRWAVTITREVLNRADDYDLWAGPVPAHLDIEVRITERRTRERTEAIHALDQALARIDKVGLRDDPEVRRLVLLRIAPPPGP